MPVSWRCLLAVALICACSVAAAADSWAVADADARVRLAIESDLFVREQVDLETVINFNELLGADRALAAQSLTLLDEATGQPVPLALAEDAELRYASGNPVLRLRWASAALASFEPRAWQLYMRTTRRGADDAWVPLAETFLPQPEGLLFTSDLETPDPGKPDVPRAFSPGGKDVEGETTERVWSDEQAHSGSHALKIARTWDGDAPTNSNRPFWWTWPPSIRVSEGQSLRLSAWLKAERLEMGALASVALEFRDADNARLGNRLLLRGDRIAHDWKLLTGSATAPAGAAAACVWFSLHGEGEAYCDDLRVMSVASGTLPRLQVARGPLQERAALAAAAGPVAGKLLKVGAAAAPPTLDGALDDACWQSAGVITEMEDFMRVPGTEVATTILVCADRDALYFGFDCQEPATDGLLATTAERDGPAWRDDSVELFLDTNLDRRSFYQVIVNPKGFFFDQDTGAPDLPGAKWNGPIETATRVLPDRWTAEVRLAFTGLRLAEAAGRTWGANFARTSMREGRSCYTWVKLKDSFGQPALFGEMVLPFDPTANVVTGRVTAGDRLFWGAGEVPFEVSNNRAQPVEVRVTITDEADDAVLGEQRLTVQPRSVAQVGLPCTFAEAGQVTLRYDLSEEPSGTLLYTTSQAQTVPEPLALAPDGLVSHLDQEQLTGRWTLGIAEGAAGETSLRLSIMPEGVAAPAVTETFAPEVVSGVFAVGVAGLPAGAYQLRAELLRGDQVLATQSARLVRAPGPFSVVDAR